MQPKVFVGNLNFDTTADELRELFSQAGRVVDVAVPPDRNTGRPRGFAFVEFATGEEASAAIERFDGQELAGRTLRVNEAGERPAGSKPQRPSFGGGGGFGTDRPAFRPRPKGSRRNIRSRKRSVW
jgi:RNA recognition motif-containing protein